MNNEVKVENQAAMTKYIHLITNMEEFKARDGDDPPKDETGKEINHVQDPIVKHEAILCKCHQNKPITCQFCCKYL